MTSMRMPLPAWRACFESCRDALSARLGQNARIRLSRWRLFLEGDQWIHRDWTVRLWLFQSGNTTRIKEYGSARWSEPGADASIVLEAFRSEEGPIAQPSCLANYPLASSHWIREHISPSEIERTVRELVMHIEQYRCSSTASVQAFSNLRDPFEMIPAFDISAQRLNEFCRKWQITDLWLFGSVLRNDFGPASDVDVLVSFAPDAPWSAWDLMRTRHELAELIGRDVDLLTRSSVERHHNPYLKEDILRDARRIYAE